MFSPESVAQLAKYKMVTIEKWYTPCAAQRPRQGDPSCAVEAKMFETFRAVKKLSPNTTCVMYLNSMFNFNFYSLAARIDALEASGKPAILRDHLGEPVLLCNDGGGYCNVSTFDLTKDYVRQLWIETVRDASTEGLVAGVFADHGQKPIRQRQHSQFAQYCNNAVCYNFTQDFAERYNAAHFQMLNETQDMVSRYTAAGVRGGGPVVEGPYSNWHSNPCDFRALRAEAQQDRVILANVMAHVEGGMIWKNESCLAAFLCAMEQYTYLAFFYNPNPSLPTWAPIYDLPLGKPQGPAEEGPEGVWKRTFVNGKGATGKTVAVYNEKLGKGHVDWSVPLPTV